MVLPLLLEQKGIATMATVPVMYGCINGVAVDGYKKEGILMEKPRVIGQALP